LGIRANGADDEGVGREGERRREGEGVHEAELLRRSLQYSHEAELHKAE